MSADPSVREIAGVVARKRTVAAHEREQRIDLYVDSWDAELTPAEARHLARQLLRLARRVESRSTQP